MCLELHLIQILVQVYVHELRSASDIVCVFMILVCTVVFSFFSFMLFLRSLFVCCALSVYGPSGKVVVQSIAFRAVYIYWQGDDPFP